MGGPWESAESDRSSGLSWAGSVPGTGPGDRVVVLGAGQRGLCCVIAARAAGARRVVVTGLTRDAHKLALARRLGADVAIDVETNDVVQSVRDATGGGAQWSRMMRPCLPSR